MSEDLAAIGSAPEEVNDNPEENTINVQQWLNKIAKGRKKEKRWRDRAKKCIKIYRDDSSMTSEEFSSPSLTDENENTFNILWANIETLLPALFSAVPNPDVRSRYMSQNPDVESASQILERCLSYSLDTYNFPRLMKAAIKDYLITGRSVLRVRLIPEFENTITHSLDMDGNIQESNEEVLTGQSVRCELVHWDAFVIDPVKRFEDVNWMAFIHMLTERDFEEFFPGADLTEVAKEKDDYDTEDRYKVYEVWDKLEKKVYFLGDGAEEPLKIMDDPFQLTHFWPIPEPLYSIQTNDSLVPIPEYTIYQSQADELNQISYRITDLVKSCKLIGIYDAQQSQMSDLLQGRDSQFFSVQSNLMRDGGLKSVLDMLDVSPMAQILSQLFHQRDQIKSIIYEVTGISDIIRGESQASETATAQNIKASYAGLRLRDRRDNINRFIVDLLRMKAELIGTFFTTDQMSKMSGIEVTPSIEQIIKSDILRNYKVDIETDSTILADMDQQAQKRAAIVSSITQFISVTAPLVAQGALPVETAKALLQYALQPTKISRELEDALEMIGKPAPPPPPQPGMPPQQGMPQHGAPPMHQLPHPQMHVPQMPQQQNNMGIPNNEGGGAIAQLMGGQPIQ
jgi:hypothetical protein